MVSNELLSIQNVDIAYGDRTVIKNFSLNVNAGEFVSILGPSGCGKTTILRAIAGFIPTAKGSILLDGKNITRLPPEARDVGIVFQSYALFPTMTAYENIAFGLRVAKKSNVEIEQRVTDIAKNTGIFEQLQKKPAEMSGGQQQRVAIARALIMGTNVLLFDEPLSNLDSKIRVAMRKEIKRLQARFGFTSFFVTHDQDEALALSDRIVVLQSGNIEQVGTARELYETPANPFVCQFIGEANFLSEKLAKQLSGNVLEGDIYIRPEDIRVFNKDDLSELTCDATVSHIEYLGAEVRIDCKVNDETIRASLYSVDCAETITIGSAIRIGIRNKIGRTTSNNALHVFARQV
jgi:putative spermidine/putrescine transport system ATP-binding protein